jgi:hypothetical protein
MRTRALIVLAVAALALAGCGDHNLVLKVDVLSYFEDAQKNVTVGDVPAGSLPVPVPIVRDTTISLIDGLNDVTKVTSVTLSLGGHLSVASGSGTGRFKVYVSDEGTDPLTTAAIMDVPVTFSAAAPANVDATAAGSPAVAELFTHKKLRLAVVLDGATIAAPGASGLAVTLSKLDAVVIAGRKGF